MALIKSISGIRGTIGGFAGDNLTPQDIVECTAAFGTWVIQKTNNPKIVIGRDARISGEFVSNLVINTLRSVGISVVDLGLSTTPTVEENKNVKRNDVDRKNISTIQRHQRMRKTNM